MVIPEKVSYTMIAFFDPSTQHPFRKMSRSEKGIIDWKRPFLRTSLDLASPTRLCHSISYSVTSSTGLSWCVHICPNLSYFVLVCLGVSYLGTQIGAPLFQWAHIWASINLNGHTNRRP